MELSPIESDTSGVSIPPPLVYLAVLLLATGLEKLWPAPLFSEETYPHLGDAIFLAGVFLMLWSLVTFSRKKTSVDYRAPTTAVVRTGPFRFSRNPIYVGLTLVTLGLLLPSLWGVVLLIPACFVITKSVIAREEVYLERKFGDEFRDYKARVRRWV